MRVAITQLIEELSDTRRRLSHGRLLQLDHVSVPECDELRLRWPNLPKDRRLDIIRALADLTESAPDLNFDAIFLIALDDEDENVRAAAVEGLWENEERSTMGRLLQLLRTDESAIVRAAAARGLRAFALLAELDRFRPADLTALDTALRDSLTDEFEEIPVRARAMETLGVRSRPWVPDLIEWAYRHDESLMRVAALHAMGESCDTRWLPRVIEHLSDPEPAMRFEAATAAGSIADPSAVPGLLPLLDDRDSEVQEAAIAALGEIGGERARRALRERAASRDARIAAAARDALAVLALADAEIGLPDA